MKKKIILNNPKWYQPFKLKKRNEELERVIDELLLIIDDYSDELRAKKKLIEKLKKEQ